jgi:hypothetical protein
MNNRTAKPSPLKYARIAGFLYLIVNVTGVFAQFFVRSKLIVSGDAATTANNIIASEWLFRLGFVSDLIASTCYFLVALTLYVLLKPVNKNLALLCVLLVSISTAIMCLNMVNQFAAILLLSGAEYLTVFERDQLQAVALFFLNMHSHGYVVAGIFFWRLAHSPRLFGFQVGLLSQSPGRFVDNCVFRLPDRSFPRFSFPALRAGSVPVLRG